MAKHSGPQVRTPREVTSPFPPMLSATRQSGQYHFVVRAGIALSPTHSRWNHSCLQLSTLSHCIIVPKLTRLQRQYRGSLGSTTLPSSSISTSASVPSAVVVPTPPFTPFSRFIEALDPRAFLRGAAFRLPTALVPPGLVVTTPGAGRLVRLLTCRSSGAGVLRAVLVRRGRSTSVLGGSWLEPLPREVGRRAIVVVVEFSAAVGTDPVFVGGRTVTGGAGTGVTCLDVVCCGLEAVGCRFCCRVSLLGISRTGGSIGVVDGLATARTGDSAAGFAGTVEENDGGGTGLVTLRTELTGLTAEVALSPKFFVPGNTVVGLPNCGTGIGVWFAGGTEVVLDDSCGGGIGVSVLVRFISGFASWLSGVSTVFSKTGASDAAESRLRFFVARALLSPDATVAIETEGEPSGPKNMRAASFIFLADSSASSAAILASASRLSFFASFSFMPLLLS